MFILLELVEFFDNAILMAVRHSPKVLLELVEFFDNAIFVDELTNSNR